MVYSEVSNQRGMSKQFIEFEGLTEVRTRLSLRKIERFLFSVDLYLQLKAKSPVNILLKRNKVDDGRSKLREVCQELLKDLRNDGLLKNERVITSKQGTHIEVRGQNTKILNFCANNYLGLSVSLNNYFFFSCAPELSRFL